MKKNYLTKIAIKIKNMINMKKIKNIIINNNKNQIKFEILMKKNKLQDVEVGKITKKVQMNYKT